jgi:hypothetical protein
MPYCIYGFFLKHGTRLIWMVYLFRLQLNAFPFIWPSVVVTVGCDRFRHNISSWASATGQQITNSDRNPRQPFSMCPSDMFSLSLRHSREGTVRKQSYNVYIQHVHTYPHAIKMVLYGIRRFLALRFQPCEWLFTQKKKRQVEQLNALRKSLENKKWPPNKSFEFFFTEKGKSLERLVWIETSSEKTSTGRYISYRIERKDDHG